MPNHGIKISKNGEDVKTVDDLGIILSSEFNQFKISAQNTFTITIPAGEYTGSITIPHNLGYEPAFMVWLENTPASGKKYRVPYYDTTTTMDKSSSYSDSTNIVVELNRWGLRAATTSQGVYTGYYFIFKDNLA